MDKLDLHAAHRSVKIHPDCYPATRLKWKFEDHSQFTYMYDSRLAFDVSCSGSIFYKLTQSANRMVVKYGVQTVSYAYDILTISKDYANCRKELALLIALVIKLGFHENWSKVEGHS